MRVPFKSLSRLLLERVVLVLDATSSANWTLDMAARWNCNRRQTIEQLLLQDSSLL
jgi:hypothetical protein